MTRAHQFLDGIVRSQKLGQPAGIGSVCSAHPDVLKTVLRSAAEGNAALLVESTCNQVNQYGGYTGMTPDHFVNWLRRLAHEAGFPHDCLIIGGDHLGPNVWQKEPAASAMQKSHKLVADYIRAGYQKIHLDTSMHLGDDPKKEPLPPALIAARAAELAKTAEDIFAQLGVTNNYLRYVIGTEVPPPGGMHSDEEMIHVTKTEHVQETLELTRNAFRAAGLDEAWQRVVAVVVHPGVEFGNDVIYGYDCTQTSALKKFIEDQPGIVYEAHSTDYQTRSALTSMVADHFAILKVGPALTFAYREAIFALARIEQELLALHPSWMPSNLMEVLEKTMLEDPQHWQNYYHGSPAQQAFQRRYSFSDRIRYYWSSEPVQAAVKQLTGNLTGGTIPLSLLSQHLPQQYQRARMGIIEYDPPALIQDAILAVWEDYNAACHQKDRPKNNDI